MNGHELPPQDSEITKSLSEFVIRTSYKSLGPEVVQNLKKYILDYIGVAAFAASNIESSELFLKATLAFYGGVSGQCTVLTKGQKFLPQCAALLNAAYAHTLDFDDTFKEGALHPGASVISAALVQAELSGADGKKLLTGVAVGYEVICRLSKATSVGAYTRGFHNTGTCGIFGAIAAIMSIKGTDSKITEAAFGIAGSKAASSMQFLENGAWNKRLHPGFAVHDAMMCIAFAEGGVVAASQPLEGRFGFLKAYSDGPILSGICDGLGEKWIHLSTALKPYPGCRMTHSAIDMAAKWRKTRDLPVKSLKLSLSSTCWPIVGKPAPNKLHPRNIVDAQFSAYYQLALAWLDGNQAGWAVYSRLHDADVNDLLDRITVDIGQDIFALASRLTIVWEDGTVNEDILQEPLGEPSNPMNWHDVNDKFQSLSGPVYGKKKAEEIMGVVERLDECQDSKELMSLLA